MSNYFILDTNIFLHYTFFTGILWLQELNLSSATLLIPPTTMKELDEKKYTGKDEKIRNRAKKVIKRLADILENDNNVLVNNIQVQFIDQEPNIDWDFEGLSPYSNDDRIIATIMNFKSYNPYKNIILVTADLGMIIKCKTKNITTKKLDEKYLMPKIDEEKKELIELRKRLYKYETSLPKLEILFKSNKANHIQYCCKKIAELDEKRLKEKLDKLKSALRYIPQHNQLNESPATLNDFVKFAAPADGEVERYEHDLNKYIDDYKDYLHNLRNHQQYVELTYELIFLLVNSGTSVAEDIDIFMHFPDGFEVYKRNALPKKPKKPSIPMKPQTIFAKSISSIIIPSFSSLSFPDISRSLSNNSGPTIRRTNSYEVHFKHGFLKHNMQFELDPICIVFNKFEDANSFEINYRILLANCPDPQEGKLHVILKKSPEN